MKSDDLAIRPRKVVEARREMNDDVVGVNDIVRGDDDGKSVLSERDLAQILGREQRKAFGSIELAQCNIVHAPIVVA